MDSDGLAGCLGLIALAVILALAPVAWVVRSSFEAAAYNRVTGAKVSTWDAMWIELRVTADGRPAR